MAIEWLADDSPVIALGLPQTDGLLDYLHTLFRVAHATEASHWCTPGHNRGRVRAEAALVAPPVPLLPRREDAR